MTTIAFHDGVMASDGQECACDSNGRMYVTQEAVKKIHNIHGRLYGFAGEVPSIEKFIKQLENQDEVIEDYYDHLSALEWDGENLYTWGRRIRLRYLFSRKRSCFTYERIRVGGKKTFYSIGSGWKFARDAHKRGKTLEECIKSAADNDPGTNKNIWLVTLEKIEKRFNEAFNPWYWMAHQYGYRWETINTGMLWESYMYDTTDSTSTYSSYTGEVPKSDGTKKKLRIVNIDGVDLYIWT